MGDEEEQLSVGRLTPGTSALFVCDMQEKFRSAIFKFQDIISNTNKLVESSNILKIPVFVTEQYPKGLGSTVSELRIKSLGITPVSKTCFTMALPELVTRLRTQHPLVRHILLTGVESHVCVLATCQDFTQMGYTVHVLVDCTSSRSNVDRMYAYEKMKKMGAWLTTAESVILSMVGDSRLPQFKSIQALIREKSLEAGLNDTQENNPGNSGNTLEKSKL